MDGVTLAAMVGAAAAVMTALSPSGAVRRLQGVVGHERARSGLRGRLDAARQSRALPAGGTGLDAARQSRALPAGGTGLDAQDKTPLRPGATSPSQRMDGADSDAPPDRRRIIATLAALAGGFAVIGGIAGVLTGCVLGIVAWVRLGRLEPAAVLREREHMVAVLPLAAGLIAAALAAGSPPEGAVEAVGRALPGPLGRRLTAVSAALRVGTEPDRAWAALAAEPALRSLARVMTNAARRGTSPASALERIARDSEDVARWAAQARARSVGAKAAVPLGLCFLPAFILVGVVPLIATSLQLL